jgi:lactate dehydrogenase-like 2-hydroxyacid dehydrogenase
MSGENRKLRVLITCKWPDAVEAEAAKRFDVTFTPDEKPLSPQDLVTALQEYDAILATITNRFTREVFASAGAIRTKIIANFGVGYAHIDAAAAKDHGVIVANTPGVLTDCTADTALLLMLMVARRATEGEKLVREQKWAGFGPTHFLGTRLTGKTLGVIGMGRIGQATAQRCHFGFGMDVVFHNRSRIDNEDVRAMGARQLGSIEEVLRSADFISLHCPGGAENRHLINRERIAQMKPSAFLINTARGEVVDEEALADALESGAIAGAGLDVFENEPNVNPRLLRTPNTSVLPHIGSATKETRLAMGNKALENLIAFAEGREVPNRVN